MKTMRPLRLPRASELSPTGARPMNPMEIYDAPGKSKMGMDLVPVYEDELVGGVDIKIDPVVEQEHGRSDGSGGKRAPSSIRFGPTDTSPMTRL